MLLERLCEYEKRFEAIPPAYGPVAVRWLVDLDRSGAAIGFVPMDGEGKRSKRGKVLLVPHVGRTSKVAARLLADRADYVLQVTQPDAKAKDRQRTQGAHKLFVELVGECAKVTAEPTVAAVDRFLRSLGRARPTLPEDLAPGDFVTFRVNDVLPIELPSVRAYWAERQAAAAASEAGGLRLRCLVCGTVGVPAKRHRIKIKGIPDGQPSGTTLVSANMPAFESYGLHASLTAPICEKCAADYANGANRLIQDEHTHLRIGSVIYLFWTRNAVVTSSFVSLLSKPEPGEVKELLRAAWTAKPGATKIETDAFYATGLAASGGRVAVREWLETTVEKAREHLARYFLRQRIVGPDGREWSPMGIWTLATSLVPRVPGKPPDIPPNIPTSLLRFALAGVPLPEWILAEAVRRARTHRQGEALVTHPRAAVIKMVLLSVNAKEVGTMEELDPTQRHPAYLCGRVFAIIEAVQRAALGNVTATVTDRYFGAAATSPAYVLGKLVNDARKAHFGKLRRQKPAVHHALDQRLAEVLEGLAGFPDTLTLEEQGRFVLGYYHQRAADFKAARARRELRDLAPKIDAENGQSDSTEEGGR